MLAKKLLKRLSKNEIAELYFLIHKKLNAANSNLFRNGVLVASMNWLRARYV